MAKAIGKGATMTKGTTGKALDAEPPIRTLMRLAGVNHSRRRGRRISPTRPSHTAEVAYRSELLQLVAHMRKQVDQILLPVVREESRGWERKATGDDFSALKLMVAFDKLAQSFGGINLLAMRLAATAVKRQEDVTNKQLASGLATALGADKAMAITFQGVINSLNVRQKVEAATVANVELIKSIPSQFHEKAKAIVLQGATKGQRYTQIAEELQKQLDVTEGRAKFIARDQMAKLNASITEAKQTALGIKEYEWVTAGDERVRESHREKNGQTFLWSNPPDDTGHPGEDYNCRCIARPIIKFD